MLFGRELGHTLHGNAQATVDRLPKVSIGILGHVVDLSQQDFECLLGAGVELLFDAFEHFENEPTNTCGLLAMGKVRSKGEDEKVGLTGAQQRVNVDGRLTSGWA